GHVGRQVQGGGVDEGLETRQLDRGQAHAALEAPAAPSGAASMFVQSGKTGLQAVEWPWVDAIPPPFESASIATVPGPRRARLQRGLCISRSRKRWHQTWMS